MKRRYVRHGDSLADDIDIVVRGGELDPDLLRTAALSSHSVYGSYEISVFALRDATLDELAQQAPLVRFAALTLISVGALRVAGLRLEPTGRNARHFSIAFDDVDRGIAALTACEHRTVINPYNEP